MASVYILYSKSLNQFHIGSTKNLQQRLTYHLQKEFKGSYTVKANDWELFFEISDLSLTTAIKIEAHIKRMKSRKYLTDLKEYPEMKERLIQKYNNA